MKLRLLKRKKKSLRSRRKKGRRLLKPKRKDRNRHSGTRKIISRSRLRCWRTSCILTIPIPRKCTGTICSSLPTRSTKAATYTTSTTARYFGAKRTLKPKSSKRHSRLLTMKTMPTTSHCRTRKNTMTTTRTNNICLTCRRSLQLLTKKASCMTLSLTRYCPRRSRLPTIIRVSQTIHSAPGNRASTLSFPRRKQPMAKLKPSRKALKAL